jgi:hypothetical protein
VVAEGAGACSVAAALAGMAGPGAKKVVCVVSGGGLDTRNLVAIMCGRDGGGAFPAAGAALLGQCPAAGGPLRPDSQTNPGVTSAAGTAGTAGTAGAAGAAGAGAGAGGCPFSGAKAAGGGGAGGGAGAGGAGPEVAVAGVSCARFGLGVAVAFTAGALASRLLLSRR